MINDGNWKHKWILGVNSAYHEPAACLIRNGEIVAAAEEERFNRVRHGKPADLLNPQKLPTEAIRYCLDTAGITAQELDAIGFSFMPTKRLAQNVAVDADAEPGCAGTREGEERFHQLLLTVPQRLSEFLGADVTGKFHWIEHHLCHAASAYFVSPFDEAAILSVDGIGETTSTWLGVGKGHQITPIKEIRYPNSLGFLWTKMSRFLGFGEYGQWKVMSLAGFGDAERYYDAFRQFVAFDDDGNFSVNNATMQFRANKYAGFEHLFGKHRLAGEDVLERHQDMAAALQCLTNEIQLSLARWLHRQTGLKNLCQAGGVALNCIANRVILEEGPFENVFIQPAANDAGTAMGACFYLWNQMQSGTGVPPVISRQSHGQDGRATLKHAYLGPEFDATAAQADLFPNARQSANIAADVASLLARGEIVAWFQGRMEWGPRALGNRSILADPRRSDMVHVLNEKIKHREFFRPFAASVLAEKSGEWFQFAKRASGDAFMLYSRKVQPGKLGQIPAVTHIDGTSRIQCVDAETNPRFHQLIREFETVTRVPLILNTSLNDQEPIICTPENAVETCTKAGIRYLAIGDWLVDFQEESAADLTKFGRSLYNEQMFDAEVLNQPVELAFRSR